MPDVLYENLGDGRFRDVSASSGHRLPRGRRTASASPSSTSTATGSQDIFVGNDSMPTFLFVNQGGLRFAERALAAGLALNGDGEAQATMGIAIGDVNADGRPDVFTTNFANDTNTLRVSLPGPPRPGRTGPASTTSAP